MDKLNQNLPKLKALSRRLADVGAITTFSRTDSLLVLTVVMGNKTWQAECKTTTELVENLSAYYEGNVTNLH